MTLETMVSQRADGKFVVGPTRQVGEAGIFDSIGAVARPFGRVGEGPGESGRILNVLPWPGDSVMLAGFDRLIVLGPEGRGRTIRLERTSASHRTTVLPADGIVVRNYSYPPDRQFVAFNNDGSIRAEMGYTWKSGYRGDGYEADGQLGPAQRAHAFWSGSQRYRIRAKLWDARDGTLLRTLRFDEPWFTPYDSAALTRFIFAGNDEVNPPPPFMRGIRESADSVLWMLYNIPARNWAPVDDTLPPLQRQWRRAAYDGVINLVDPASGQVLLATWTNVPLTYIVNDSLLVDRRVTDDGFLVFDVYKVKFRRH